MMWSFSLGPGELKRAPSGLESKSGKRMREISVRFLSERQLKINVRGWDFGKLSYGGAQGPGTGGVVGYVEKQIGKAGTRGGRASEYGEFPLLWLCLGCCNLFELLISRL